MAGLEVQIGANTVDFKKKIAEVEDDIQKLANEKAIQIKLGLDTKEITNNIKDAKKYLNDLKQTARDTGASFAKDLTPKVANGGNALMQFSRIAQDAPFGIMGIGNNITATAESFGYLVKETGSAGSALKAVASSIMGTGGILLAVSLVTTGLTIMAQQGLTVGDVFAKLSGTFDENARALSKLNQEATKSATEEIAGLKALTEVAKDENLSREKRLIAVQKLQNEYPAYFGNLSKEKILNGEVSQAVFDVSKALIQRARAQAIAGKLGENAAKRLELEEKREQAILDIQKAQQYAKETEKGSLFGKSFDALDLNRAVQAYKDIVAEIIELDISSRKYSAFENQAVKDSILLLKEKAKAIKKTYNTPQVSGVDVAIKATGLEGLVSLEGMLTKVAKNVEGYEGVISTSLQKIPGYFDTSTQQSLLLLYEFNNELKSLVQGSLTQTFNDLGSAIGKALAEGRNVFGAIGKSLLASLGNFISDMGGLLIKYGTLAVAKGVIDKALTSGNPVVTIAAGAAAIAVGIALKAAGGAISSKANSNSGSSGSSGSYNTGASYSSPSSSFSSSGGGSSSNNGTVVFEIAGNKLIGVLNNTLDSNKRLGGALGL